MAWEWTQVPMDQETTQERSIENKRNLKIVRGELDDTYTKQEVDEAIAEAELNAGEVGKAYVDNGDANTLQASKDYTTHAIANAEFGTSENVEKLENTHYAVSFANEDEMAEPYYNPRSFEVIDEAYPYDETKDQLAKAKTIKDYVDQLNKDNSDKLEIVEIWNTDIDLSTITENTTFTLLDTIDNYREIIFYGGKNSGNARFSETFLSEIITSGDNDMSIVRIWGINTTDIDSYESFNMLFGIGTNTLLINGAQGIRKGYLFKIYGKGKLTPAEREQRKLIRLREQNIKNKEPIEVKEKELKEK